MFTSIGKREKKVKEKMVNKAHRVGKLKDLQVEKLPLFIHSGIQ